MARPNYSFAKLQRERAKKKKKEDKLKTRAEARGERPPDEGAPPLNG